MKEARQKVKRRRKEKKKKKRTLLREKKSNLRYSRTYVIIVPAREFLTASWEKRAKEERKKNED